MTKLINKCIYCDKRVAAEADHIPPACLFPSPRPNNLVTVPACSWCNRGASQDDEYFRMMLVMRSDANHPAAKKMLDPVHRSLARPQKRGMLNALLRSMKKVRVRTPAGLYLGTATTYNADLIRMARVTDRIVKGLYWTAHNARLPDTHTVRSFAESGLGDLDSEMYLALSETVATLARLPGTDIGKGVFSYSFQATGEDPATTAWLLRFYELESFLCITAPSDAPSGVINQSG